MVLPDIYAPLKKQRAAMRALQLLYPDEGFELRSHTDGPDGTVTRTVKMEIKRSRNG
jgi:hypothetical protein